MQGASPHPVHQQGGCERHAHVDHACTHRRVLGLRVGEASIREDTRRVQDDLRMKSLNKRRNQNTIIPCSMKNKTDVFFEHSYHGATSRSQIDENT